jgi:hypothetical protein
MMGPKFFRTFSLLAKGSLDPPLENLEATASGLNRKSLSEV